MTPERSDDGDLDVLDGLAGLVEKSLLRRVDTPGAEPRVAMLQTIREFAADRLDQRPDVASRVRRAHALYYADLARRLRADLMTGAREAALEALHADVGNLRIAWTYWVEARDLEHLDGLAKTLLALDDAHGWYLDTAKLATDMLAVLDATPSSADRVNQEIALRTTVARALMTTKGVHPRGRGRVHQASSSCSRARCDVRMQYLRPARARQPVPVPRAVRQVRRDRSADPRARRVPRATRACRSTGTSSSARR